MTNLSKITLRDKRAGISKGIAELKKSMDCLKDPRSDFAEHHQHVMNTYREVLRVLDVAILESEDIGHGI